jgi:hypothetical protein
VEEKLQIFVGKVRKEPLEKNFFPSYNQCPAQQKLKKEMK